MLPVLRIANTATKSSNEQTPGLIMTKLKGMLSILILLCACPLVKAAHPNLQLPPEAFWIKNHWKSADGLILTEPVNWRKVPGYEALIKKTDQHINTKGLDKLFMSGSASPSQGALFWLEETYGLKHPVYIIDLRQETHVLLNGLPISIFYKKDQINWGKSSAEISESEQNWVKQIFAEKKFQMNTLGRPENGFKVPIDPVTILVKTVSTEAQAVKKTGMNYFRIHVPDYHPPSPQQVDQFLTLIAKIPQDSWLHFHCAAGKGRTTLFMVMRDIVANGKELSLEDIVNRQVFLGGINVLGQSKSLAVQPWKGPYHQARIEFLKLFYTYIHTDAYLKQKFGTWIVEQPNSAYKSFIRTEAYQR
jgi:hypothetical protein